MAHSPPDHPAQDVAASLIAGHDAITDEKSGSAAVISDHLDGDVLVRVTTVAVAAYLFNNPDNILENVDIVVGGHLLQDRGNSLQTGAGVD